ncbi:acyl-CoA dehydrogenase [Caproiciproducens sp. NJN-50]|uniref:acyl-CoA dehydrogenase family protein n=1 Tax=Acutalibacteraceae TaxID=3082771 RepID=UPI000FFE2709|nr:MULTISPECIES: acyl-CoA dehydrogenase family protein [Acutalibacteraceae]QAT49968.1 acyl-CoA dehydrogenase [Caproiciproducens sp. NJN-50]
MIITDEMKDLQKTVRDYMTKEVVPVAGDYDERGEFPEKIYNDLVGMGLNLISVPEEYGGLGLNRQTEIYLSEEIGKYEAGIGSAIGANNSAASTLELFGTEEQKAAYYGIMTGGKWAAFCLTEPNAGSDAASVRTTATLDGEEYVLNGTKCFITNGGIAGVYTVFASTDRSKGTKGLSAFYVEADRKGVSSGKHENKMGIRLSNTTEVIFDEVRIPRDHLIGQEGKGFIYTMKTLDTSRPSVGALATGLAQRALTEAIEYSKVRVQFGKPICANQAIQFMLADMQIQVESARQVVYHTAELMDAGEPYSIYSAMSKVIGSDTAMKVATDALQIHGGYGYMKEYPMEKLMRDAKILQIYEGTNQVQRMVIANNLLK